MFDNNIPRRVYRVRGGAIAASYNDGTDVGIGHHTVTVFAHTRAKADRAVLQLRRRRQSAPPTYLPAPIYPRPVMEELKRVAVAHRRLGSVDAVAHRIGMEPGDVRTRLRMARLFGDEVMSKVRVPTRSWRVVERERRIALWARALGKRSAADRYEVSEREVRRILDRVRGLSGGC